MLSVNIPGKGELTFKYLVLDYNGTLAEEGELLEGVEDLLRRLAGKLEIYILTADTFGTVQKTCSHLPVKIEVLQGEPGGEIKRKFIKNLGALLTVAVGNGLNDAAMLETAGVGIAVIGPEGCASSAMMNADVVVRNIEEGLKLLLEPSRLVATLRY